MQETTYEDGHKEVTLMSAKTDEILKKIMKEEYQTKMEDPRVTEIRQKRIDSNIVLWPAEILKQKCVEAEKVDSTISSIIDSMFETMKKNKGLGLAAPQIGIPSRFFVMNVTGKDEDNRAWINPEVVEMYGMERGVEGCLSFPGVQVEVGRAKRCIVRGWDKEGNEAEKELKGLEARVFLHEFDHCNGITIYDKMNGMDKIINKKAIEALKAAGKE